MLNKQQPDLKDQQLKDQHLKDQLKDSSYKLTGQRQAILELLRENSNKHLNADDIYRLLSKVDSKIGIATVYRTLAMMEKLRLVSRIQLDDGCVRYQISDPEEKHEHHHLVCEQCGAVIDVQDDLLDSLEKRVLSQYGFRVTNHKVKIFGICRDCESKC
ncbi:MAG: transcriptional repressor [Clostridiales bacterium]|nr:transcriptional repressor [Clostridiales bacterium]